MTPLATPSPPRPGASFDIGWRDVYTTLPDGTRKHEQIPLTLEDALHPQEGDTFVQNTAHNRDWRYLQTTFEQRLAHDPHALVLGDCKVLWEDGTHHSPDLAVIFDVRDPKEQLGEFDVAEQGTRPRLIVEVVSPSTRSNDVVDKVRHFHKQRVPQYVIVDRVGDEGAPTLIGYEWTPRGYDIMSADENGRMWLEPLGLTIGFRDERVVLYDGETGEEVGDYIAVCEELAQMRERADRETERADAEAKRAKELAARADREEKRAKEQAARADAEAKRAEQEAKRAEQEAKRAVDAEKLALVDRCRADDAEETIRRLEAELARLKPPR